MAADKHKNLLLLIEKISHEARDSKFDFSNGIKNKHAVIELAGFLSITFEQAVLFACITELSLQNIVTIELLAKHINCSVLQTISQSHEIEALERKSLVKRKRLKQGQRNNAYGHRAYTVPYSIIECLRKSNKKHMESRMSPDLPNLLEKVDMLAREREIESIPTGHMDNEIAFLIRNNPDHAFLQYLNAKVAKTTNKTIAMVLAYNHFTGLTFVETEIIADQVFENITERLDFRKQVINRNHELVEAGVIFMQQIDYADQKLISLTNEALYILYKDYPELLTGDFQQIG